MLDGRSGSARSWRQAECSRGGGGAGLMLRVEKEDFGIDSADTAPAVGV
jgi:hypothetical protein